MENSGIRVQASVLHEFEQNKALAANERMIANQNWRTAHSTDVMIDKMIAQLAYQYWEERGRPMGSSQVDWYRAADEVKNQLELHELIEVPPASNEGA